MEFDNHIEPNLVQSDRAMQDDYHRNYSSQGGALRGGHVGQRFPIRSHVPAHHDHPNDPAFYPSGPPLRGHSRQAIDDYLSTLPVRGRYTHITCISRRNNGTIGKTEGELSATTTTTETSPSKISETSAYYVEPELLSTFRQQSDDATLTYAAMTYVDKTEPKKKTKAQIDREADAAEQQAVRDAEYRAREAARKLNVARRAYATAKGDTETVLVLQYAENAAKNANDEVAALKQSKVKRRTAEFYRLVADAKQGSAERQRPIQVDTTCSIGDGVPSDNDSSEEEEDEEEDDVVTDEEHDIAYADGLAPKPTLLVPPKPNVTVEELSCFRTISDLSDRRSMEQKMARSKDLILRAQLNKLKMKKLRARKKRSIKKAKHWVDSTAVDRSEPLPSAFEVPEAAIEEPESQSIAITEDTVAEANICTGTQATSSPTTNRVRRVVFRMSNGKRVIRNTTSPNSKPLPPPTPSSHPGIELSDYIENEMVCCFLRPWFDAHQASTGSSEDSGSDMPSFKHQAVVKFLEVVADSVEKAKAPLQIGCKKLDEMMNPGDA